MSHIKNINPKIEVYIPNVNPIGIYLNSIVLFPFGTSIPVNPFGNSIVLTFLPFIFTFHPFSYTIDVNNNVFFLLFIEALIYLSLFFSIFNTFVFNLL